MARQDSKSQAEKELLLPTMPKTLLDYPPVENIYNIKLGRYTKSNYQNILNANRSRLIGRKGSLLGRQMRSYTRTFSFPWRLA